MNIHTPERASDETMKDYRRRQALSKALVQRIAKGVPGIFGSGGGAPKVDNAIKTKASQNPKLKKQRKPGTGKATGITWVGRDPRRLWREGEPIHVIKPVRAARLAGYSPTQRAKAGLQSVLDRAN